MLADNPRLARLRHDMDPPLCAHPFSAHMIFYREEKIGIEVIRILHGRQDWHHHLS